MIVLGIETSCDETAAGVIRAERPGHGEILSDVVRGQVEAHAAYGGVVPEIAARAHVEVVDEVVAKAMADAGLGFADLDLVAATAGPGLIGGLLVGLTTGKAIAAAARLPFRGINHLEAHALTARLTDELAFPYLLLLVSGGHSQFILVEDLGSYRRWGTTIDDALGEAFDKTAKLLGLGYPGGPEVEKRAADGDPTRFAFPRPLADRPDLALSFAGLKTAVRLAAERTDPLDAQAICDICAGFQAAIADVLAVKAARALAQLRSETGTDAPTLVAAGGVASNRTVRQALAGAAEDAGGRLVVPPARLCTDNGVMIAWAGAERAMAGLEDDPEITARPRWPLDADAAPLVGYGRLGVKV
ncbi:tRNA (adenosine(37)-N6)-threonylcarbamoyltransferase complex transferase subunit TsaD [Amorphus orientalis]|uniref:tRNA N6-adenosine threonylcarbamoyltransferase n=1 Tax=Amorphus orientalis TaxID=649198 RepID=A0AAE3VNA7_9HYPH|nr:tRNA (adenosine(37)-N6)-threonylcarbamoyltransferase complex transferase subunit TsaD [Amorphus orientalis]MDQ0315181.1 N6-L-threonylcarbamoyladenine synthase [Amorphus orientalis]